MFRHVGAALNLSASRGSRSMNMGGKWILVIVGLLGRSACRPACPRRNRRSRSDISEVYNLQAIDAK